MESQTKSRLQIIGRNLLNVVNSVYTTGADAITSVPQLNQKNNAITFKFRDNNQSYDCQILNGKISYVESSARKDSSYNILIRLDTKKVGSRGKTKKCKNGKPCGDTCIQKGDKCVNELSESSLKTVSSITKLLAAGALAGAVVSAGAVAFNDIQTRASEANFSNIDDKPNLQKILKNPKELKKYADEIQESIYNPNEDSTEDKVLKKVWTDLGYTEKPTVVTSEELDKIIQDNPTAYEMYRGINDTEDQKYSKAFIDGDYHAGFGYHGNGTYAAIAYTQEARVSAYRTASSYAGDINGQVLRMALKPDAKIATVTQVQKEISDLFGGENNVPEVFKDTGVAASILGYDAFSTSRIPNFKEQKQKDIQERNEFELKRADYFVILNRKAVFVQDEILKPNTNII